MFAVRFLCIPCIAFILLGSIAGIVTAQEWSDSVFPVKQHHFGDVARASRTEFRFPVRNTLDHTIHIRSVRASCGCTTPTVETPYIQPGETGYIHAQYNTDTHKGQKGATLTVTIDQPFFAEVRLRVDGYIRTDVVVHPGAIEFGNIPEGAPAQKSTQIMYAGRDSWRVVDVMSNRPWLTIELNETSRGGGRVNYELTVAATADAPVGPFQDELTLVTNDSNRGRVPIRVSGRVESALTLSPKAIALGDIKPGEKSAQRLVLRGSEPFTIAAIEAEGWEVDFQADHQPKKTHILLTEFAASGELTGPQKVLLRIIARGTESITATAVLTANVLSN